MDQYVGEIRAFAFGRVPSNWLVCAGQTLPVQPYQALFSLFGSTYGGDGRTVFCLPNLSGRVPVGAYGVPGSTYALGKAGGVSAVKLDAAHMPSHTHALQTAPTADGTSVRDAVYSATGGPLLYAPFVAGRPPFAVDPEMLAEAGGDKPHNNMQPFVAVQYCIAAFGVYPMRG